MVSNSWDTPPSLWISGRLVPWDECVVHVTSPYAQRGASVFDGIRLYKTSRAGTYLALALTKHLQRLDDTWQALSLPISFSTEMIRQGLVELLSSRNIGDCYCRVTRYLDARTPDDAREPDGVMVALFKQRPLIEQPVACVISSWRRTNLALPAQMKIGGHYFLLSWLRQQARQLGADDAILLNDRDLVCEATGTAIFVFLDGELVTPPISDGALPSITAQIVTELASKLDIPTSTRSVHRTQLFRTQGAFLAGTLDELRPITTIDNVRLPDVLESEPIAELFKAYAAICRAERESEWSEFLEV